MNGTADRGVASATPQNSVEDGWLRRWYGSGPAHLVTLTLGAVVGLYAGIKLVEADPWGVIVWLLAAAVLHDIVLVPAYTGLDRAARGPLRDSRPPFWYDHIRVPVLLAGLLLLVFFPLILRFPGSFPRITGTSLEVYLPRYLALVASLFALSGLALVVRVVVRRRRLLQRRAQRSA